VAGDDVDHRASDGGPTLGEIGRRLDGLSSQVRDLKSDMNSTYVRQDVYRVEMKGVTVRIDAIEQGKTWTARSWLTTGLMVLAALVTTLLTVRFGIG
jgi:hypothetical protein